MLISITCQHCGKTVPRNARIKTGQKYCSDEECQKARIRRWKRLQYAGNKEYREKCHEQRSRWRKNYPSDRYQRDYRATHPGYVKENREKQRERNLRNNKGPVRAIVKADTLLIQPRDDGAYNLIRVKKNIIVNRNALSIQFRTDGAYTLYGIKHEKIVNRNTLNATSQ